MKTINPTIKVGYLAKDCPCFNWEATDKHTSPFI